MRSWNVDFTNITADALTHLIALVANSDNQELKNVMHITENNG